MKALLIAMLAVLSLPLMAEEGPGCPSEDELSAKQGTMLFDALKRGDVVIRCTAGVCVNFANDEPVTASGGIPKDGFYVLPALTESEKAEFSNLEQK